MKTLLTALAFLLASTTAHGLTNVAVTVPGSVAGTPCADSTKLAACLNALIEGKTADQALTITIKAGTYTVDDTVLIFQRDNVAIQGTLSWFGTRLTTVKLGPSLAATQASRVLQYFHFNVIDSSGIAIRSLKLDGLAATLKAERGIAVCPLARRHLSRFEIRNVEARNYAGFFTLIGNGHAEHLRDTFLRQTPVSAGEARLRAHLLTSVPVADRFCNGTVSDVRFENNALYLKNVGFYVVPLASGITGTTRLADPTLDQPAPGTRDWLAVNTEDIAGKQTGYVVRGNSFVVDLPADTPQSVQETAPHSAIKVHACRGMVVDANRFDAGPLPYTFGSGAAVNLAAGMLETRVTKNTIKFPPNHRYPQNGVFVHAGHGLHPTYGIGTIGLFPASLETEILGNTFQNARVRIWDACANEPGLPPTGAFCDDMSATPGGVKADGILIRGNRLQSPTGTFVVNPDQAVTWRLCIDEAAFVARLNALHPNYVQCRPQIDLNY